MSRTSFVFTRSTPSLSLARSNSPISGVPQRKAYAEGVRPSQSLAEALAPLSSRSSTTALSFFSAAR